MKIQQKRQSIRKLEEKKKPVKKHKDEESETADEAGHTKKVIEELSDPKSIAPGLVELLNDENDEEIHGTTIK